MNGLGSSFSFGQPASQQQGTNNAFGSQTPTPSTNGLGFGAKRTQSAAGPSTSTTGGLFGSANPAGSTGGTGLFGQANNTAQSQPSTGLFGSTNNASTTNTLGGGSTLGSSAQPGGLFGSTNNNNAPTNTTSGFSFGSAGGLGSNNNLNAAKPSFGSNLFGSTSNASAPQTGGGLFGNKDASKPAFGSSLGQSSSTSTNLFGQSNNTAQPSTGGGLFGGISSNNNTNTSNAPPSTSLFGQSTLGQSTLGQGGLFSQQNQQQNQQQQLVASIDQASYTLPGVAPSQKLYTSLSIPNLKRGAHETDRYEYEETPPIVRTHLATPKFKFSSPQSRLAAGGNATLNQSTTGANTGLISSKKTVSSTTAQGEPRKWINSYEKFVKERPTTLTIRQEGRKPAAALLPGPELAPVATEPPAIAATANDGNSSVYVNPVAESSMRSELPATVDNEPDVSLFHRQANNMTLVRVNKRAIEEGYYIYPRLEDLASMSKSQLSAVKHLVVGRENFGQIEYPAPVDLSHIHNLGDILGTLVIFGAGTVCVYPDEETKAQPGRELNKPCTVTIENAWPKDAVTHQVLKDMEDSRMIKHIQRLRSACETRGGEFVTFAQGTWVFKVPHFSTWGLPADEMVVDGDEQAVGSAAAAPAAPFKGYGAIAVDEEVSEDDEGDEFSGSQRNEYSSVSPEPMSVIHGGLVPQLASSPQGSIDDEDSKVKPSPPESVVDFIDANMDPKEQPQTWLEQLTHASNGVLLAAAGSLAAASEVTSKLDLEDILNPSWKASARKDSGNSAADTRSADDSAAPPLHMNGFNSKASSLKLTSLRQHIKRGARPDSDVPLISTDISFADISKLANENQDLWQLLSILFDNPHHDPQQERQYLSAWFETKTSSSAVDFQGGALDTIWSQLKRHQIKDAYKRAIDSNNLHLALLIAMLGNKDDLRSVTKDAEHQLNDWKATRTLPSIPLNIRRVWELAAGRIPSGSGFTWAEWLGVHIWYFADSSIKSAVNALPSSYQTAREPATTFLEVYSGTKQLRTAVNELDVTDSFLCLEAMLKGNPQIIKADQKFYDNTCLKLAELFHQSGDYVAAAFAALHITDSKVATKILREILCKAPISTSLPLDFGVPEKFLDEARAAQVAREGEYLAQADYLVRAGLYNDAHNVILATVGPEAVLHGTTSQILGMLSTLDSQKQHIKRWDIGGNVYLMYARSLAQEPDQYTVVALCNALRYVATPTLKSRQAISRIAEWVAATPYAKTSIPSKLILRMKFDPSQLRVQVLQEAARLLE